MGQALYRDYRPKSFDEVVGQDHITTTLKKAIKSGRISHAYLFTGPRGVGKTSIARILAHEVNNLPYDDKTMHLDIIEIDAASNNGVEDVRELRDKVNISPTSAKYKVYIIDEVHMLSKPAFNALLKTLEEPPAHAIFILATTEAHKVPETIVSRTQRFEFKPIAKTSAAGHLADIAKKEKIKAEQGALELLAEHGEGSFRDSISLLDQLRSGSDEVTEQDVRDFLGLPPAELVTSLYAAVAAHDTAAALTNLDELRNRGANPATTAKLLAREVRAKLISGMVEPGITNLLRRLVEVPGSRRPEDNLEIAVLEACALGAPSVIARTIENKPQPKIVSEPVKAKPEPAQKPEEPSKVAEEPIPQPEVQKMPARKSDGGPLDDEKWEAVVARVRDQAASLYTALRLATPEFGEGKLTLAFQFPLHQKKVNQAEHKDLIGRVVAEVTGQEVAIEPVVDKTKSKRAKPAAEKPAPEKKVIIKPADDPLGNISNIFGAAEVVESKE